MTGEGVAVLTLRLLIHGIVHLQMLPGDVGPHIEAVQRYGSPNVGLQACKKPMTGQAQATSSKIVALKF